MNKYNSYSQYTLKIMDGGSVVCFELMYKYEFMEWWNPDPVSIVLKDESRFVYPSYSCCCWFFIFYFMWMTNHLTHIRIWHRSNVTSSLPNNVGKINPKYKTFAIVKCFQTRNSIFFDQRLAILIWRYRNLLENDKLNLRFTNYLNVQCYCFHDSLNCIGVETIRIKANLNAILTQHGLEMDSPLFSLESWNSKFMCTNIQAALYRNSVHKRGSASQFCR